MSTPTDPAQREPRGDRNRRVSLGIDPEQFAAEAGISVDDLRAYENAADDHMFSPTIAQRVGETLGRLEQVLPNSEAPGVRQMRADLDDTSAETWIREAAYFMWEADGRPHGREDEYWHRARDIWRGQHALDKGFAEALSEPDPEKIDRAVEISRKIGLQRPYNKDPDDTVSGGFNQKR